MSRPELKPLLGLLVLLLWPCLGLGGRAVASFALAPSRLDADTITKPELQQTLHSDRHDFGPPTTGAGPSHAPRPLPTPPTLPRSYLLAYTGSSNQGASSPGSGTVGVEVGFTFILPIDTHPPGATTGRRLFLSDARHEPPPFASRWFRPPR